MSFHQTIGRHAAWLLQVTNDVKENTSSLAQLQRENEDLHARHMSLGERVDYLEKLLGESAEKHTQVTNLAEEVEALRRQVTEREPAQKVEHLDAAMRQLQDIHEDLKKEVEMASSGGVLIADLEQKFDLTESRLAMLQEHVDYLEPADQSKQERVSHFQTNAMDQSEQDEVFSRSDVTASQDDSDTEDLEKELALGHCSLTLEDLRLLAEERLDYLERMLGDTFPKINFLQELMEEKHASLQERMDYFESMIGDPADHHKQVPAVGTDQGSPGAATHATGASSEGSGGDDWDKVFAGWTMHPGN